MKIKNLISENIDYNKLIMGIALISILTASSDKINKAHTNNLLPLYEVDENGVQKIVNQPVKNNYIDQLTKIMSANNYAPIKTLYKLQSILDDVSILKSLDLEDATSNTSSFKNIFSEIRPFLNENKVRNINEITNSIEKAQSTLNQISSVKNRISNMPENLPKNEKIKTLINEIPNLADIPVLNEINNIKNMLNLIGPQNKDESAMNENTDLEYNEILDFVDMFEK